MEKVTAMIEVRVTPQRDMGFDKVAERIYNYPEVNAVFLISGGFDLLVTLEGKTLREVSQFVTDKLSTLDSVLSTKTNFILKKYKDHGTIIADAPKHAAGCLRVGRDRESLSLRKKKKSSQWKRRRSVISEEV